MARPVISQRDRKTSWGVSKIVIGYRIDCDDKRVSRRQSSFVGNHDGDRCRSRLASSGSHGDRSIRIAATQHQVRIGDQSSV